MQQRLRKLPIILCYILAFVFAMKQIREPDIWWQLLSGRWMLENSQITHTDIFSYTMNGVRWVNVKWLYEVLIAGIEKMFGPEGVMLLQGVVNLCIVFFLGQILKQVRRNWQMPMSAFFTVISVLLFFVMVEYRMAGRPEMISHLMCAMMLWWLFKHPQLLWKHMPVPIALLCLWANMHEGYPIGMVMIATYAAGSAVAYALYKNKEYLQIASRAAILFILAALAILINPNGVQLWLQTFEIFRQVNVNKYTTELYNALQPEYWNIQAKLYISCLVLTLVFWIVRLNEARKEKNTVFANPLTIFYLLLIILFGYLSLTANRNIPFAVIVLFPSLPVMAAWVIDKGSIYKKKVYIELAKRSVLISTAIVVVLYISVVNNSYYKTTKSPNRYGLRVDSKRTPIGAAEFIKQYNINGTAFSDYFGSSYLLWALYPNFKSYIDLRDLDIFPAKFFDDYFKLYNEPERFDTLNKKYNFNYVVLANKQLSALQRKLYWGEGYNMIYVDMGAVIFLKNSPENNRLNQNLSIQKLFSNNGVIEAPAWATALSRLLNPVYNDETDDESRQPVYAAKFYNQVGQHPLAIKQLLPVIGNFENDAEAQQTLGDLYLNYARSSSDPKLQKSRLDSSFNYLSNAEEIDENLEGVYNSLGNWYVATGNYPKAQQAFKKSIRKKADDDYAYYMLGMSHRMVWLNTKDEEERDAMVKALRRANKLNPANTKANLYLAEGEMDSDNKEAVAYLKKAIAAGDVWDTEETKLLNSLKAKAGL